MNQVVGHCFSRLLKHSLMETVHLPEIRTAKVRMFNIFIGYINKYSLIEISDFI